MLLVLKNYSACGIIIPYKLEENMQEFNINSYIRRKLFYLGYKYDPEENTITKTDAPGYFTETVLDIPNYAEEMMSFYFFFRSLCLKYLVPDQLPETSLRNKVENYINRQKAKSNLTTDDFYKIFTLDSITNCSMEMCIHAFKNMVEQVEKLPASKAKRILNLNNSNNEKVLNIGFNYLKNHENAINRFASYHRCFEQLDKEYKKFYISPFPLQEKPLNLINEEQTKLICAYKDSIEKSKSKVFLPLSIKFFEIVNKNNKSCQYEDFTTLPEYNDNPEFDDLSYTTIVKNYTCQDKRQ